jgi:hypothetical protein
VTSFTHSGLSAGTGFDYRVRACDASGCSGWSNSLTGFAGGGFLLSVTKFGSGSVTSTPTGITCGLGGSDCSQTYAAGTVVFLDAVPFAEPYNEWEFDHWEGSCSGTANGCTLTMNAAQSARAVFRVSGRG